MCCSQPPQLVSWSKNGSSSGTVQCVAQHPKGWCPVRHILALNSASASWPLTVLGLSQQAWQMLAPQVLSNWGHGTRNRARLLQVLFSSLLPKLVTSFSTYVGQCQPFLSQFSPLPVTILWKGAEVSWLCTGTQASWPMVGHRAPAAAH